MKRNIFKKVGRMFTSLVLVAATCLTMSVSVFASGYDLEDKEINYRDYLYFVIDGQDYKMSELTTEPGVDFSGKDTSALVYAKVDMDGLNAAMQAAGSKNTYVLHKNTYMTRYEKSTDPIKYTFTDAGNGTYAIVDKNGVNLTLEKLAYIETVGLYIGTTESSVTYYYGMDALIKNLFKLNLIGDFTAKATVTYVDEEGNVVRTFEYETETKGMWGESVLIEYKTLPYMGTSYEIAGDTTGKWISYGYENEIEVEVRKIEPDFTALEEKVAEVEKFLAETKEDYTKDSMDALKGALTVAKNILDNKDAAIQDDVNTALKGLTEAKENLAVMSEEILYLKDLQDKVAEVEKLLADAKEDYTKESLETLKDALADAKTILADLKDVKQADVDKALKALIDAKESLVPVKENDGKTESEESEKKEEATAPVTGDSSFAGIALSVMALCLAAGTVVFVKRKHI